MSSGASDAWQVGEVGQKRFPSLGKLGLFQKRVPFVAQTQYADCAAACLTMVLGYHGHEVELARLREVAGVGRDGASAATIIEAANHYGLRGRGLRIEIDDFRYLPPASILHWNFSHFVVFERLAARGVWIVDPGAGRRFVPFKELSRSFTGAVLAFEPTETLVTTRTSQRPLLTYLAGLRRRQGKAVTRVLSASAILQLFGLVLPLLVGLIVDRVVPRSDHDFLALVAYGVAILLVFQFLFSLIRSHLMLELRTGIDTQLTLGFLDHLVALPYAFFQRRSAGDLMMRVNSNAAMRDILTASLLSALLDGCLVISYLAAIALISSKMAALVAVLGVAQAFVFFLSRRQYRDLMAEELEARAHSQGYLAQMISGMETLKLSGAERPAVEHWSNLFVDELNVALRRGRVAALVDAGLGLLETAAPLAILAYGAIAVMAGEMSIGTMLALNALAMGFLAPLSTLVSSCLQLQLLGGFLERMNDVLTTEPEQPRGLEKLTINLRGDIELDEVCFAYDGRSEQVIKRFSLRVPAGSSLAVVGGSGSGKSTLAKLLAGVYTPTSGVIRYDGHDVTSLDRRALRRSLGVAPQAPYLFSGPIRRNIALVDPGLGRREVVAAAKLAAIHDEICRMPMGYETIISDGGTTISGGQRQRIALARALVHRPPVLILDEATSQLDARTELTVMRNLESFPCTRIIIAHRLSTIVNADRIVVMNNGVLEEAGTHQELLAKKGIYAQLVAAQMQSAREAE